MPGWAPLLLLSLASCGSDSARPQPPRDAVEGGDGEGEGEGDGEGEGEPAPPSPAEGSCVAWPADLPGLHERLSASYRPIDPAPDLGGELNRYTTARHLLFTQVERLDGGLECVYTGRFVATGTDEEPDHEEINCEHTWPRDRMVDEEERPALYEHQQSDLHHLFPSDARTNSARGSLHFGEPVAALDTEYAPAQIGDNAGGDRVFAPRSERRGDVARGLLYYSARWGADIGAAEEEVLRRWAADDPPDDRERARNDAIEVLQGNRNPFIDCPEIVSDVADFVAFDPAPRDTQLPLP